ncbi:hypothetical protein GCM10027418_23810 [Mariniluteicoccus endophyticus]
MSGLNGPITAFTKVLGRSEGDDAILDAVDEVGTAFVPETMADGETYWSFNGEGVEFLYEGAVLTTVFFHRTTDPDDPELGTWERPLIEGLPIDFTQEQALTLLGTPEASGHGDHGPWHRFTLDQGHLHLDFSNTTCRLITIMHDLP